MMSLKALGPIDLSLMHQGAAGMENLSSSIGHNMAQSNPFFDAGEMNGSSFCSKQFSIIVDKESKKARVFLYTQIGTLSNYKRLISFLNSADESWTIFFFINSPGGSITSGFNIAQAVLDCRANLITVNMGMAASMGSAILIAGKKILVMTPSTTMFHMSSAGSQGNSMVLENQVKQLNKYIQYFYRKLVLDKGILTEDEVNNIIENDGNLYLSAANFTTRLKTAGLLYTREN